MGFKKHSPTQDSIFKVYQNAFSMIGPVQSGQLKNGDVVHPKSMIRTVATSLPQDEEVRQELEREENDGM